MPVASASVELTTAFSSSSNAETTLSLRMSMPPLAMPGIPGDAGRVVLLGALLAFLGAGTAATASCGLEGCCAVLRGPGLATVGPGSTTTFVGVLNDASASLDLERAGAAGCVAGFCSSSIL